jgi:hypothetical protein
MAQGDFSASYLGDILVKQQEMWANPRSLNQLNEYTETAQAILSNQMVRWLPIMENGRKCIGVKATWLKDCDDTVTDCSSGNNLSNCDISGHEIESDSKLYPENLCIRDSFKVMDDECKDQYEAQEKIAFAMIRSKQKIQKKLNTKIISFLDANITANLFTGTYGDIDGTETYFAPSYWTQDIIAEFDLTNVMNKIRTPIVLNGSNLRTAVFNAQFNQLNSDQKDQAAKFGHMKMYWDLLNIDTTVGSKATYLVDAGGVGFFNLNNYMNTAPEQTNDNQNSVVWHETSPNLSYMNGNAEQPLKFDITMLRKCTVIGSQRLWGYHYEVQLRGGLHLGPPGCGGATDTGILKIINGTAP